MAAMRRPAPPSFTGQHLTSSGVGVRTAALSVAPRRALVISCSLTGKEKRALRAYAHGQAKKVPTCIVGDAGLTPAVITSAADAIKTNELIRMKMAGIDKAEFKEAVEQVAGSLDAEVAGTVGRVALLYRRNSDGKGPISTQHVLAPASQAPAAPVGSEQAGT
eukprot:jgi/Tetstr1/431193/TSEL_020905.t1